VAKSVVLEFALKKLQQAERTARKVVASVKQSRTLTKEEKREQLKSARESLKEVKERRKAEGFRVRGQKAAGAEWIRRDQDAFDQKLGRGVEVWGKAVALAEGAKSLSDPRALAGTMAAVGALVPGVGQVGVIAGMVFDKVWTLLEERQEREWRRRTDLLMAELAEQKFQSDYEQRLKDDPLFAREQAERAYEQLMRHEDALGQRIERSAGLLEDYGF